MNIFLTEAFEEAKKAKKAGEVPIGAVIVFNGKIIARGKNNRERRRNAIMHAELNAINKACKRLKSWRLDGCEMYVTLEPCPMCAGAIVNARIKTVYVGAREKTSGEGLCSQIFNSIRLNHNPQLIFLEDEACSKILTDFFKEKR